MSATSSYLARVIYKTHTSGDGFEGTYNLILKANNIPNPLGKRNTIETTTYEDDQQTYIAGIRQAEQRDISGNLEKDYLDSLADLEGEELDIIHLYGSQGIGEVAKVGYRGTASVSIGDLSGIDQVVGLTATITPTTVSKKITDEYTVVDNKDGSFTVTKKA